MAEPPRATVRGFESVDEPGWPSASGGQHVARAIAILLDAAERGDASAPWVHFDPPIGLLIAPEQGRQRDSIRKAIERVIALIYPDDAP